MILEELAYKVTVRAEDFLSGKKKVEQGAKDLGDNVTESFGEVDKATKETGKGVKAVGDQVKKTSDDTKRPFGLISGGFLSSAKAAKEFGKQGKTALSDMQIGAAKYLGLALSIEGARRMFTSSVNNAVDLKNVSSFLDMDPKEVDGWKKSAESVGSSAEAITSTLLKMKNASAQMNGYGGPIDSSTGALLQLNEETHKQFDIFGTQDPGEMTKRYEAAYRTLSRSRQLFYLNNIGVDASLDPSIRDGSLDTNQTKFKNESPYSDKMAEQAVKVKLKVVELDQAIKGVGNSLVLAFGDDAIQTMDKFDKWVTEHKDDIIGLFKDGAEWAKKFTDAVGGTANALNILIGIKNPYLAAGIYAGRKVSEISDEVTKRDGTKSLWQSIKDRWNAGGWYNYEQQKNGDQEPVQHAQSARRKRSNQFGMDALAKAVMMVESRGNPNAVSPAGAVGAYQFMPGTARDMGLRVDESVDERTDPVKSKAAFMKYMNLLLNRYGGNTELALMAYNGGMGRVDNALKGKGKPLAQETMDYPGKVADYYQQISEMAGMQGMAGMQTQSVDNSQTTSNHYGTIQLNTNPQSIDEIAKSIDEQRRRSTMTGAFISGNG